MAEAMLTEDDIDDLRRAVFESQQRDGGEEFDATLASVDPIQTFCLGWPAAKEALELLLGVLQGVNGSKLFARAAISTVIVAGDAASSAVCGSGSG